MKNNNYIFEKIMKINKYNNIYEVKSIFLLKNNHKTHVTKRKNNNNKSKNKLKNTKTRTIKKQ